jgi:hypothetical protein
MSDHTATPLDTLSAHAVADLVERLTLAPSPRNAPDSTEAQRRDEDFLRRLREAGL